MNVFILVVLGLSYVCTTRAYVYVQVQKGDKDTSNVDALIHKEVPSDRVDAISDQLKDTFHKKKMIKANYKRFEVRKRNDDENTSREKQVLPRFGESKKQLDNLVLAVDKGAKPEPPSKMTSKVTGIEAVDKLLDAVKDFSKDNSHLMRAREEYNINPILDTWRTGDSIVRRYAGFEQPELIQFRNSAKPSLRFEVNSESIVKLAKELLASPTVRRYAEELAQKAAVIFKVIKDELKKDE